MFSLLRDSCYGNIIRILTRGRFFKYEDETHPELWHRYINIDKSADMARGSDASSSSDVDIDTRVRNVPSRPWEENGQRFQGLTGEKVDPEKGTDIMMVDWLDDKDQDVSLQLRRYLHGLRTHTVPRGYYCVLEPPELAFGKEGVCHLRNMPSHLRHLHREFHILCWRAGHHAQVSCQPGCRDSRAIAVCCRLWNWALLVVSYERDPGHWTQSRVYPDAGCLRCVPGPGSSGDEFGHAARVPVSDWILRVSSIGNG